MRTRRWYYFVPAKGAPRKLVHRIESPSLDTLPGEKLHYSAHQELDKNLAKILGRAKTIAMQYSPKNAIPYVSNVDAGTVEMVRSLRRKVVSSADLVQGFEPGCPPRKWNRNRPGEKWMTPVGKKAFRQAPGAGADARTLPKSDLNNGFC